MSTWMHCLEVYFSFTHEYVVVFFCQLRNWGICSSLAKSPGFLYMMDLLLPPQRDIFAEAVSGFHQMHKDTHRGGTHSPSFWTKESEQNPAAKNHSNCLLSLICLFACIVCLSTTQCKQYEMPANNIWPPSNTFVWFALFWQKGDRKGSTHVNCHGNSPCDFPIESRLYSCLRTGTG